MQSDATTVADYLAAVPDDRRAALERLRQLCRDTLHGYDEGMDYGMPGYARNGTVEVGFASQKRYISLYILKQDVLDRHRDALRGLNVGKGCVRYTRPDKMDFELIERLLVGTRESDAPIC